MKVTLLVRASKKPEKRVVVERDVVIGRGKDCDLRVLSNDVSRRHCQLVIRESEVAVRDFGSGNGTLMNSQKIETDVDTPLISGDILRIGPLVIKVEFESSWTPPDTLEPEVQTAAGNSTSVEAATSQRETSVPEVAAELIADEPDAQQFLEPASDELLPDDDSAVDEVAGADSASLSAVEPVPEASAETEQQPGKMKSMFGLFGRNRPAEETDSNGNVEPADASPASESELAGAETRLVAEHASFEEETVVFDQGTAFTPDEEEPELLAVDDEGLSDESDYLDEDYLDEEVEDSPVDLGFADFLNSVDQPPK
jgi:pSer/pThr/pTyr-binding forkhead associated (FHA) protein